MRNRSPLESDDSENSDENEGSSCSRSNSRLNSLNWHIANREWMTGHVTTEAKPKNLQHDAHKSEDAKSSNLRSKLKEKSTKCSSCLKRKSALCKSEKIKFGEFNWCCCWHRSSETSVGPAPSTSKKKKRKKVKKKSILPKKTNEPEAEKKIQQETEKIEKKHEHLHEEERRPVNKLIEDDTKPVKIQQEPEIHVDKSVETYEEKAHPELRIQNSPLVTAGTSVDIRKSCCYLCTQNAMLIFGALGTLVAQKNIHCQTDTKSTQVAVKYRITKKPEPIVTYERGTICQRSDLPNKFRNGFRSKKFKIPKNIRNMFTRDQIVTCDARSSTQPRRQTICCMKNCRFID